MIVVGVDGSDESKEALRWALTEARLRRLPLRVVHAWQLPVIDSWGYFPPDLLDSEGFEKRSRELIEHELADVDGDAAGVEIEPLSLEGVPARALIDASEGADLLVVGSRGRGGFSGMLLGSVSQHCVHHASCPVVVIRAPKKD